MTAVVSACIFKNLPKLNFCAAILTLKMEDKTHFWHIMLYYIQKGKNTTEMQKILAVYGEGAVTNRTCQKWFAVSWYYWYFGQILCCGAVSCIGRCLAAPLASTH